MIPGTDQFPDLIAPSGDEYLDETELALVEGAEPKARSQWQLFRRRFLRHKAAVISTLVLLILIVACFGATWLAPYQRNEQDLAAAAQGPSTAHWMGTDRLGRDLFTEILYAGQISLQIGLAVAFLSTAFGAIVGAFAAYFGKGVDQVLSRVTDLFLVVPALLVAATALSYVRQKGKFLIWDVGDKVGPFTVDIKFAMIVVLAFLGWTYIARIVRGQVLSLKEKEYIEAAPRWRLEHADHLPAHHAELDRRHHRERDARDRGRHRGRSDLDVLGLRHPAAELLVGLSHLRRARHCRHRQGLLAVLPGPHAAGHHPVRELPR